MPKMYFGFDDGEAPKAKEVKDTKMLEPREGKAAFETGENTLDRYSKPMGNVGPLGDRSLKGKK